MMIGVIIHPRAPGKRGEGEKGGAGPRGCSYGAPETLEVMSPATSSMSRAFSFVKGRGMS